MSARAAFSADRLIRALEGTGPYPALVWYEESGRVELSGHVLANWFIKASNHLRDELMLEEGTTVLLAMPPHWKRLVIAVAAWSLGAEVRIAAPGTADTAAEAADVVVTDDPASAPEGEEVLAVDPVSLALRFSGELPPMVIDWAVDVRAHADRPTAPLQAWSGPAPAAAEDALDVLAEDGVDEAAGVLAALLAGRAVVGPAARLTERRRADEGLGPAY